MTALLVTAKRTRKPPPLWVVEINYGRADSWMPTVGASISLKDGKDELERWCRHVAANARCRLVKYRREEAHRA